MLVFEAVSARVDSREVALDMTRARVPGGWLVHLIYDGLPSSSICFVPDQDHKWDPAASGQQAGPSAEPGLHTHVAVT
jgi:hypothetical protein